RGVRPDEARRRLPHADETTPPEFSLRAAVELCLAADGRFRGERAAVRDRPDAGTRVPGSAERAVRDAVSQADVSVMRFDTLSLDTAMRIASLIAAIGILWDAGELVTARTDVLGRFFDWPVIRSRYYILNNRPVLGAVFDATLSGGVFNAM